MGSGLNPAFPQEFKYLIIYEPDNATTNLSQHFPKCHKFIRECIQQGGHVLIHCYGGVSRSATTTISFLMREYGMGLEDSFNYVASKRWFINPNKGFR